MYQGEGTGPRLSPHLILSETELEEAVASLLSAPFVVIDVETTSLDVHTNEVIWVGLSSVGQRYLVPLGHPKGYLVTPAHTELEDDMTTVRPYKNNPNKFTKPKKKKVHYEAVFTDPPEQIPPHRAFKIMEPLFFSPNITKVGHNFKFDLHSVAKYYGGMIPRGPYVDTVILLHIVDENRTDYKLKKYICEWMLGKAAQNSDVRARYYPELGKVVMDSPIDWIAFYLQKDITHTQRAYLDLMRRLDDDLKAVLEAEMAVYPVVLQMEHDGTLVDMDAIAELGVALRAESAELENDIARIVGYKVEGLTNPLVRKDLLFKPKEEGGQGLTPRAMTAGGHGRAPVPRLKKEDLAIFAETNELARLFESWGENQKLLSSFVDNFAEHINAKTGRVHASFKQHGTVTGRSSCADPNLQQIPARTEKGKLFRKAFVSSSGGKFQGGRLIVCDFDQIELRLMAYLSGDKLMTELFANGQDIHAGAAAGMYQKEIEDVTPEERANGKTLNFALGYGAQAKKLSNAFGVTKREAEVMIQNFYRRFHGIPEWKTRIITAAVATGDRHDPHAEPPYVWIPPYGRRRRLPALFAEEEWMVWEAERQAVNAVAQGYAAYVMKQALVDVADLLAYADLPSRIVLQVHDEIVVECLEERYAEETLALMVEGMQGVRFDGKPALGKVPLLASGGIGPNWVDAKG